MHSCMPIHLPAHSGRFTSSFISNRTNKSATNAFYVATLSGLLMTCSATGVCFLASCGCQSSDTNHITYIHHFKSYVIIMMPKYWLPQQKYV